MREEEKGEEEDEEGEGRGLQATRGPLRDEALPSRARRQDDESTMLATALPPRK